MGCSDSKEPPVNKQPAPSRAAQEEMPKSAKQTQAAKKEQAPEPRDDDTEGALNATAVPV